MAAVPDWMQKFIAHPNRDFDCIACGAHVITSAQTTRYYLAAWCAHPSLIALGEHRVCPACYTWDYDAHRRKRKFARGGLKLKNGKTIQLHQPSVKPEVQQFRQQLQ
jgi:hypothetical protein